MRTASITFDDTILSAVEHEKEIMRMMRTIVMTMRMMIMMMGNLQW
jgi:hypothetical protein